jgi:hypothetical protein
MQREESTFIYGRVCTRLRIHHPDVKVFTVHDSIVCKASEIDLVHRVMVEEFRKYSTTIPSLKVVNPTQSSHDDRSERGGKDGQERHPHVLYLETAFEGYEEWPRKAEERHPHVLYLRGPSEWTPEDLEDAISKAFEAREAGVEPVWTEAELQQAIDSQSSYSRPSKQGGCPRWSTSPGEAFRHPRTHGKANGTQERASERQHRQCERRATADEAQRRLADQEAEDDARLKSLLGDLASEQT